MQKKVPSSRHTTFKAPHTCAFATLDYLKTMIVASTRRPGRYRGEETVRWDHVRS